MRGFCEQVADVLKVALKKGIGKLSLTGIQLQTTMAETKAALNSRLLIYLNGDMNDQVIIPAHFLSMNVKNGSPQIGDQEEAYAYPDNKNKISQNLNQPLDFAQ